LTVEALLAAVCEGFVRLPTSERPLRWRKDQLRLLLHSVANGYPIGTLLLWRLPAESGTSQVGPLALQVPRRERALWVVDGQHRIASPSRWRVAGLGHAGGAGR